MFWRQLFSRNFTITGFHDWFSMKLSLLKFFTSVKLIQLLKQSGRIFFKALFLISSAIWWKFINFYIRQKWYESCLNLNIVKKFSFLFLHLAQTASRLPLNRKLEIYNIFTTFTHNFTQVVMLPYSSKRLQILRMSHLSLAFFFWFFLVSF